MTRPRSHVSDTTSDGALPKRESVRNALRMLLRPLARLALAHGVKYQDMAEVLKLSYVDAGHDALAQHQAKINASALSVATGVHRKDLAAILDESRTTTPAEPPVEAKIFARWLSDPQFLDRKGLPRALQRTAGGEAALPDKQTFEQLTRLITTDVRPAAVLASMQRLGLVHINQHDQIVPNAPGKIPVGAPDRMLDLLRDNSLDHLNAATHNLLGQGQLSHEPFLEQAIFANGLNPASAQQLQQKARKAWLKLTRQFVPEIQSAIDENAETYRRRTDVRTRMRMGIYFYSAPESNDAPGKDAHPRTKP